MRRAIKTCEILPQKTGGSSDVTQQTTVAVEGTAFLARLTSGRFFLRSLRNSARPGVDRVVSLTWRKDVLEAGESCEDLNHCQRGEARPITPGSFAGQRTTETAANCVAAANHVSSRRPFATVLWPRGGNSEIFNGRCAECPIHRSAQRTFPGVLPRLVHGISPDHLPKGASDASNPDPGPIHGQSRP